MLSFLGSIVNNPTRTRLIEENQFLKNQISFLLYQYYGLLDSLKRFLLNVSQIFGLEYIDENPEQMQNYVLENMIEMQRFISALQKENQDLKAELELKSRYEQSLTEQLSQLESIQMKKSNIHYLEKINPERMTFMYEDLYSELSSLARHSSKYCNMETISHYINPNRQSRVIHRELIKRYLCKTIVERILNFELCSILEKPSAETAQKLQKQLALIVLEGSQSNKSYTIDLWTRKLISIPNFKQLMDIVGFDNLRGSFEKLIKLLYEFKLVLHSLDCNWFSFQEESIPFDPSRMESSDHIVQHSITLFPGLHVEGSNIGSKILKKAKVA